MSTVALSELLGAPALDASGKPVGRVREVAICPQFDPARIAGLIVRTRSGERLLACETLQAVGPASVRSSRPVDDWEPFVGNQGYLLLRRDLLDQQIIDVHGRKVVRVNDVELQAEAINQHVQLKVEGVDVGARGAVRRLLKGVIPSRALRAVARRIPPQLIPWQYVDLIETDPARRVKLKIEHAGLSRLHPADIADIVEDLAPAEREAVFETLDEHVAAEALEEVDPKLQAAIVESLEPERAADIVEEMHPDAAADLLGDLPQETSEEILQEMEPEERQEVSGLLEFEEDTAAGRMTTDYLAVPAAATVHDAIEAMRRFEGGPETLSTVFLLDEHDRLVGAVPLPRLVLAPTRTPLRELAGEMVSCPEDAKEREVAALFDKYNLLLLPVVDQQGRLTGIITADDVITLLRGKL